MYKKLIYLAFIIFMLILTNIATHAGPFRQDPGPDGIVSIEAENYDDNIPQGEHRWILISGPIDDFTGTTGMQALPNTRTFINYDEISQSPRLDYKIKFVTTGTHYVWIRGYGFHDGTDDSLYVGLDNELPDDSYALDQFNNNYVWDQTTPDGGANVDVPTVGLHTFNIWMREDGFIIDKIVLTTNQGYAPSGDGPIESLREPDINADNPYPADGASDISRDIILSWEPGDFAQAHDIYFGTVSSDVNEAGRTNPLGALARQDNITNTYDPPERLEFEQTYYWRIDEVNSPPDSTIFKGKLWSFMTEPFAYSIPDEMINTTASSQAANQDPENTVNGSGLDINNQHSVEPTDMWLSGPGEPGSAWIQYDFEKAYKLHEMRIWNYNGPFIFSGFGIKEATIEYSHDGTNWMQLGVQELTRATGVNTYAYNTTIDFGSIAVKAVKITANSAWGGAMFNQYGLSEVHFMYIPVNASKPDPEDGATDVARDVTLSWRSGREAAEHNVYFSADEQAVIDGTTPFTTVSDAQFSPLPLDLANTYYWRVDEVNNAETTTTWQGNTWSFTTRQSLIVDDFESYNDIPSGEEGSNLVYETWIDGYLSPSTNGSTIGYVTGNSLETGIFHEGRRSAPLFYDNTVASSSEVTANTNDLAVGPDWTVGVPEQLVLWVYGDPNNPATDQMYVKINNAKVIFEGDLTQTTWQEFSINLASLGINLNSVSTLTIGFERTGAIGGLGRVFIDDFLLYAPLKE